MALAPFAKGIKGSRKYVADNTVGWHLYLNGKDAGYQRVSLNVLRLTYWGMEISHIGGNVLMMETIK